MSDADREFVLTVTRSLRELDGVHPEHEQIEAELARRIREALSMYIEEREARLSAEALAMEYRHRLVACGAW